MPGTKLFVISGPSGVGKDTIINHLKSRGRDWYFVTTATTRSIRDGEKDGKDYLFLTHDQFQAMLDRDQFIENAEVYGNRYGVPISQIDIAKYTNRHAILKIDVQGALTIKSKFNDALLIFVQPENIDQLIARLTTRNSENKSELEARISKASYEMDQSEHFDYIVTNNDNEILGSVEMIDKIISSH
ncbi:MAG: guanylate kinase [Dehalococcoidia bacterium]|tara:strand:+ start:127 stop:687 length:561 start_codon:yes stop_codon:yes gene_type:complete